MDPIEDVVFRFTSFIELDRDRNKLVYFLLLSSEGCYMFSKKSISKDCVWQMDQVGTLSKLLWHPPLLPRFELLFSNWEEFQIGMIPSHPVWTTLFDLFNKTNMSAVYILLVATKILSSEYTAQFRIYIFIIFKILKWR